VALDRAATSVGSLAVADGEGALALGGDGGNAAASERNAIAIGAAASAQHQDSLAIGAGAATTRTNQIVLGTANETLTVAGLTSAASASAQGAVTGLVTTDANGNLSYDATLISQISQNTTDITALKSGVSQTDLTALQSELTSLKTQVSSNSGSIGGNTTDIAALNAKVDSLALGSQSDVSANTSAIAVNQTSIAANSAQIATNTDNISTNAANIATNASNIASNRADIDLNTAAIGGLRTDVAALQMDVKDLASQFNSIGGQIDSNTDGIAIANALAGSSWLQANETFAVTANWGMYDGSNAMAVTATARLSNRFAANVGVGYGDRTGEVGARAGVRYGW